jgi:hypothetical protein
MARVERRPASPIEFAVPQVLDSVLTDPDREVDLGDRLRGEE